MSIDWKQVSHELKVKAREYADKAKKSISEDIDMGVAIDATMDASIAIALKEFANILDNRNGH